MCFSLINIRLFFFQGQMRRNQSSKYFLPDLSVPMLWITVKEKRGVDCTTSLLHIFWTSFFFFLFFFPLAVVFKRETL